MTDDNREYLDTHYFIKFYLDLQDAAYKLWLLLGAVESKCKHLAGIPLRPEKQKELSQISLKKGVMATTAIEGNTLSAAEVDIISEGKLSEIPLSRKYQAQEIKNMLDVYNGILQSVKSGEGCEVSLEILKRDNKLILQKTRLEDYEKPGKVRTYPVGVGNYKAPSAKDCKYLLNRLFEWLSEDWHLSENNPLMKGILKAIAAHLYLAWIHPFCNGNGRTARVLEFRLLMKYGVPSTAAHLLTSYYNDTREQYYERLKMSSCEVCGELDFIEYALQGFVDALDSQINIILGEQLNITWKNYIYNHCFGGKLTPALRRRRDLLLEVSKFAQYMTLRELRYRLPDEILRQYQDKIKMFQRDLNYLESEGMLYKTRAGYLAAKDKMKSLLPVKIN